MNDPVPPDTTLSSSLVPQVAFGKTIFRRSRKVRPRDDVNSTSTVPPTHKYVGDNVKSWAATTTVVAWPSMPNTSTQFKPNVSGLPPTLFRWYCMHHFSWDPTKGVVGKIKRSLTLPSICVLLWSVATTVTFEWASTVVALASEQGRFCATRLNTTLLSKPWPWMEYDVGCPMAMLETALSLPLRLFVAGSCPIKGAPMPSRTPAST